MKQKEKKRKKKKKKRKKKENKTIQKKNNIIVHHYCHRHVHSLTPSHFTLMFMSVNSALHQCSLLQTNPTLNKLNFILSYLTRFPSTPSRVCICPECPQTDTTRLKVRNNTSESHISVPFALWSAVFELQAISRRFHIIPPPHGLFIIQGHRYLVCLLPLHKGPNFYSVSFTGSHIFELQDMYILRQLHHMTQK